MRLPDVLFAGVGVDAKHGVSLLGAHAVGVRPTAPRARLLGRSLRIVAPARQAPIEIGFHQRRFRRALAMKLCQKLHRLTVAERGERTAGKSPG